MRLPVLTSGQELLAPSVELPVQAGNERERLVGEDLVETVRRLSANLDSIEHGLHPSEGTGQASSNEWQERKLLLG